jgi:DNA-binding response OmpR family regulator
MATLLANQNYRVLEAEDGAQALDILTSNPEVRLLYHRLSHARLDGFGSSPRSARPGPGQAAIIGVSAEGGEQTARFLKNGANDFLTKPLGMEEFYCRVNQQMDMQDIIQDYRALQEKAAS